MLDGEDEEEEDGIVEVEGEDLAEIHLVQTGIYNIYQV